VGSNVIVEENASGNRFAPLCAYSTDLLDGESIKIVTLDTSGNPVMAPGTLDAMRGLYNPALWSSPVIWFGNNYISSQMAGAPVEPWS